MTGMVLIVSSVTSLAVMLGGYAVGLTRKRREEESFAAIGRNLQEEVCMMTDTDKTPEANRGDIMREHRRKPRIDSARWPASGFGLRWWFCLRWRWRGAD